MLEQVKSIEDLYSYAKSAQAILETPFRKDDPEICLDKMEEIEVVMVTSGKYLSDAKYWQDLEQSKLKEIMKEIGNVGASTLNNYIKSKTKNENYLVNWLDRINRSATHLLENLRTVISYRKEELKNLSYKS